MQKITSSLLIVSSLILTACSKDDGKKNDPSEIKLNPTVDVNAIKDTFASQGKYQDLLASGKIKDADIYNFGCVKEQKKIDSQAKVGDRSIERIIQANQDLQMEILKASTILSVSDAFTEEIEEYLSVNVSNPSLGEVLRRKFTSKKTCETRNIEQESRTDCKTDNSEDVMENLTPAGQSFFNSISAIQETNCEVQDSEKPADSIDEVGTFTFANGKTVKARRTIIKSKGKLVCKRGNMSQEMGEGENITTIIRSNEVLPGLETYFCGGSEIKTAVTLKHQGRAIESFLVEKIAPNFRN